MNKILTLIYSLSSFCLLAQEPNDNCSDAVFLCPGVPVNSNNIDATAVTCGGCEDDLLALSGCLTPNNTVWFQFMTNATGGIATIDLTNIVYETDPGRALDLEVVIYEATVPCSGNTYSQVVDCSGTINTGGATSFSISSTTLAPNTVYYVLVDGIGFGAGITLPGEGTFDIAVSGAAVVRPTPSISLSAPSTNICKGDLVTLTASQTDCILDSTFTWTINGTTVAVTTVDSFQTNAIQDLDYVGVMTICDTVCGLNAPVDSIQFSVLELLIDAGIDVEIIDGESTSLNGTGNGNAMVINWVPASTLSNPNVLNPVATPTQTTTYYMTVTDTVNGCSDADSVTITVVPNLKIPDTFTPNGDGINDTWEIVTIDDYPNCEIIVYNRWGAVVFKTNGYPESKWWNGTNKNGGELSPGAYFYYIDLKDPIYPDPFRGSVNIVR